jgi:hypothetical protein
VSLPVLLRRHSAARSRVHLESSPLQARGVEMAEATLHWLLALVVVRPLGQTEEVEVVIHMLTRRGNCGEIIQFQFGTSARDENRGRDHLYARPVL